MIELVIIIIHIGQKIKYTIKMFAIYPSSFLSQSMRVRSVKFKHMHYGVVPIVTQLEMPSLEMIMLIILQILDME